jgi:acyl dehydratase
MRVEQARITAFGEITDDLEPLHTDPAWCAAHSPVGVPIAYGFLTLSLLTRLLREASTEAFAGGVDGAAEYPLNYGFDRVRFVAPVPVDARIRAHFTLRERRPHAQGELMAMDVVVEIEGQERPALTALWWSLWVTAGVDPAPVDASAPSA